MTETKPSAVAMKAAKTWTPELKLQLELARIIDLHTQPNQAAVKELVEAARAAAESLHHTVMWMEANREAPWRIELKQTRLDDNQAQNLSLVGYWPNTLRVKYRSSNTAQQRANILGERVEHFIRTGE